MAIEIRPLDARDLPATMRLKELAHWNQTEADWRRLLALAPRGCFAAWADGRLVATTTTTVYGRELAWIGMVLVDPEYRRRGIATSLMRTALDYLDGAGVATVKLDATPAGRAIYEALGFITEGHFERWECAAARPGTTAQGVDALRDWPGALALDRRAFGVDRAGLLEALRADACVTPLEIPGKGYALARGGTAASYAGPIVAAEPAAGLALLDGVLGALAGGRVYLDLNTTCGVDSAELATRGFVKQRDLIRMRRGAESEGGTSPLVCAIAGPEIG
jgi:GNAT superfamily N-acetyltransferase